MSKIDKFTQDLINAAKAAVTNKRPSAKVNKPEADDQDATEILSAAIAKIRGERK